MFQDYCQSQQLQQNNCTECSHTSKHPLPFLAAHHIVRTPVSAHLSRPVRSSVWEGGEGEDDEYYSYPSPKLRPHDLASSSSAESLPSPDPSESSILSSSLSHAETWPTSLSNNGQVKLSYGGESPLRSGKGGLQHHQFYAANVYNPQQQQRQQQRQSQRPQRQQQYQQQEQQQQRQQQQQQQQEQQEQQQQQRQQPQQQQQRRQAMNMEGKMSADYEGSPSQSSPSRGTVYTYTSDEMFGDSSSSPRSPYQHTMWILIYLSFLSPFLTLPIALYTLLITPILILLSPLSLLITSYPSLHTQLHTFLSPPINAQLHFILSSSTLLASPDDGEPANPVMLFVVNILSPIYAIGIGLSAWVAALFWFYAAILGDPEGGCRDGRDDGRAAVWGVMRWWKGWLEQAR